MTFYFLIFVSQDINPLEGLMSVWFKKSIQHYLFPKKYIVNCLDLLACANFEIPKKMMFLKQMKPQCFEKWNCELFKSLHIFDFGTFQNDQLTPLFLNEIMGLILN